MYADDPLRGKRKEGRKGIRTKSNSVLRGEPQVTRDEGGKRHPNPKVDPESLILDDGVPRHTGESRAPVVNNGSVRAFFVPFRFLFLLEGSLLCPCH